MESLKFILCLCLAASISAAYIYRPHLQDQLMESPDDASPSRRIVLRTLSQSIYGSYPLYDLLSISTQSGSIFVDVSAHSASSEDPSQPATLKLSSASGSVHASLSEALDDHHADADGAVNPPPSYSPTLDADGEEILRIRTFPGAAPEHVDKDAYKNMATQTGFPSRDFITSVSSLSGSISGTFPLGARTWLESHSGTLSGVELVVMQANVSGSRLLSTVSGGGSQSVRIVEDPFWAGEKEAWWVGMVSKHESRSGSIEVEYPNGWEGTIEVENGSGSVSITGRGVEIIRKGSGRVVARKGDESSGKVIVRSGSGHVGLRFG